MLEQAVEVAVRNRQLAIWDRAERPWAIAVWDAATKRLQPLSDVETATVLNHDPLIRREWRKWNAMCQNQGSLIVLDGERVRAILNEARNQSSGDEPA